MDKNFYTKLRDILNQNVVYTTLFLLSLASFIWVFMAEIPEPYKLIRWSPLAYAIGLIVFIRPNKLIGIASMTLCILYFVKLCINPITSILGNFFSIVDASIVQRNWNLACVLLITEWLIVAATIWLRSPKYIEQLSETSEIQPNDHRQIKFWGILLCGIAACIYLIFPVIRNLLCFIWQDDRSSLAANSGPFLYLFKIFFEIGKPILLFWLYWKIDSTCINFKRKALLLFLIAFTFSLMSDYRILSLLEATTMLAIFFQGKGREKGKHTVLKAIFFVVAVYTIFMLTTHNDERNKSLVNLCRLLDIYTGGFMTATAGLNVKFENGIVMFLHDIFNGSYILAGIFEPMYSTTDAINAAINASAKGIFFEAIIQARAMFGVFFPLAIVLVIEFIIRMDFHSAKTNDILYKLFYTMCGFSASVFMIMYTYTMILNFIIYKALVWLLFVWMEKHVRVSWNGRSLM